MYIIHDSEQLIGPRPAQPTTATLLTPAATNLQLHPLQSFRLLGRGHHSHHGQQLRHVTVLCNVHSPHKHQLSQLRHGEVVINIGSCFCLIIFG